MATAGLRFSAPRLQAMGLGLSADPRLPFDPRTARIGVDQLGANAADVALTGEPLAPTQFQTPVELSAPQAPTPAPAAPASAAPNVYYSPSTHQMFVGGKVFNADDAAAALASQKIAGTRAKPPKDVAGDWQKLDPTGYQQYLNSFSEPLGFFGNLGVGLQTTGEAIVGGIGDAMQMSDNPSVQETGKAVADFAQQHIGLSQSQEARLAAIAKNRSFAGSLYDTTVQAIPSMAASIGAGIAGAAVGGPAGAFAGVAAVTGTMELQSSFDEAQQRGLNVHAPEVQADIIKSTLFKTAIQTAGEGIIAKGLSPALRQTVDKVVKTSIGKRIVQGTKLGALEGTMEALAQVTDHVMFDPELRKQLDKGDIAALVPLVAQRYGKEAALAFGAGFLLGGPLGAMHLDPVVDGPPNPKPVMPKRDLSGDEPANLLTATSLPSPDAPAGLLPPPADHNTPAGLLTPPTDPKLSPTGGGAAIPMGGRVGPNPNVGPVERFAPPNLQGAAVGPVDTTGAKIVTTIPPVDKLATQTTMFDAGLLPDRVQRAPAPWQDAVPHPDSTAQTAETQAQPTLPLDYNLPSKETKAPPNAMTEKLAALKAKMEAPANPQEAAIRDQVQADLLAQQDQTPPVDPAEVQAIIDQQRAHQESLRIQQELEMKQQVNNARAQWTAVQKVGNKTRFDDLTPAAQQEWLNAVNAGKADTALYNRLKLRRARKKPTLTILQRAVPEPAPKAAKLKKGKKAKQPKKGKFAKLLAAEKPKKVEKVTTSAKLVGRNTPEMHTEVTIHGGKYDGKRVRIYKDPEDRSWRFWDIASNYTQAQLGHISEVLSYTTKADAIQELVARVSNGELTPTKDGFLVIDARGVLKPKLPAKTKKGKYAKLVEGPAPKPLPESVRKNLPPSPQEGDPLLRQSDKAFVEDLKHLVETTRSQDKKIEYLADMIKVSMSGPAESLAKDIKAYIKKLAETEPATVALAYDLVELQGKTNHGRTVPEMRKLKGDVGVDVTIITSAIETVNSGKRLTPMARGQLTKAWSAVKAAVKDGRITMPEYGGKPLDTYIKGGTEFFNMQRVDGKMVVVSKDTGRAAISYMDDVTEPIKMNKAKLVLGAYVKRLRKAPKVRMYRNIEEFKRKAPTLYAAAEAARPQGDFATMKAAGYSFGDGHVILFTDNIVDATHMRNVLAHEAIGHFGLRSIIPQAKFDALMNEVYNSSESVRASVDAAMLARKMSKSEAVEEYLADYAAVLDTGLLGRIWVALKNALNKLGFTFGDEAARYLVSHARAYVRNGKRAGAFVSSRIGLDIHALETGGDPKDTGRFAPAQSLSELGTIAGHMNGAPAKYTKEHLLGSFHNVMDLFDRIKADALSLTNYRSKENPGLREFYNLVMQTNRLSLSIKNSAHEALRMYLNPQLDLKAVKIGKGVSKTQKQLVDSMLYGAQRAAVARFDMKPDTSRPPLVELVNGEVVVNKARLRELQKMGRMTLNEFRNGFDYTVYHEVKMTDKHRALLKKELEQELAHAVSEADRKDLIAEYNAQLESGVYLEAKKEHFDGIPHLTKDSIEWKAYNAVRDFMDKVEIDLLRAKYIAHMKVEATQLLEINDAMGGRMTAADRAFILRMNRKYRDMYTEGVLTSPEGQLVLDEKSMQRAEEFLVALNKALIASPRRVNSDLAELKKFFTPADATQVLADVKAFRERFKASDEHKFTIQHKIKEIVLDEISRTDGSFFTERTIATGYTPVLREGRMQVRVVAVDPETGKPLHMKDTFAQQLSYHQLANVSEAALLRDRINDLFKGTLHDVAVWDESTSRYKVRKVKLEAVAEHALDTVAAPPQLNLNEFIIGLRRFNIQLNPKKMEQVVVTLTKQNSRARNRLLRTFQPGASPDAAKAVSGHIESRASTIAKTIVRPDLDRLLNLQLSDSRRLWYANDSAKLARLKQAYEDAKSNPAASHAQVVEAKRALDEYMFMQSKTRRKDNGGVDMALRYYSEAARAMAFMESQRNLDESDFGTGETASRIRAAAGLIQLGGSPATAALNLLSVVTNTVPYLATYNSKRAFGGGFGAGPTVAALMKAIRQVGSVSMLDGEKNTAGYYRKLAKSKAALKKAGLTADEALMLAHEIEEGVATPAQANSLIASARGRMANAAQQKAVDGWMMMFGRTEQAARQAVLLAAYRLQYDRSIRAGRTEAQAMADAHKFAVTTAEDTLGEYSVMNRPAIWRGGWQQFLYMYKIYPTMSIQLMNGLSRWGKLAMIGGLIALAGVPGLPFAKNLEDLIDTIATRLGFKSASIRLEAAKALDSVVPGWSKFLFSGIVNAYLPGDVGARVSLGDVIPGTGIFLPGANQYRELSSILGPAWGAFAGLLSLGTGAAQWAAHTVGLTERPVSLLEVARNSPVTMMRAWADAIAYTETGAVVDKRGYKVTADVSALAIAARALGFYPSAAASQYGIIRVAKRVSDYQRSMAVTFYNAYVQARLRGDSAAARRVIEDVQHWNRAAKGSGLEVNNFVRNANRRYVEARRTAVERTTKYAPRTTRDKYEAAAKLLGY